MLNIRSIKNKLKTLMDYRANDTLEREIHHKLWKFNYSCASSREFRIIRLINNSLVYLFAIPVVEQLELRTRGIFALKFAQFLYKMINKKKK